MQANLVLYNGNIHTMDRRNPVTQAVAIDGNRIAATGSSDVILASLCADGRAIDLRGKTVVPGFIDAHIHFMSYGISLKEIDLMGVPTLAEAQNRIAERARITPKGHWLTGRGWDQSLWPGGAFPNRKDLDAVAPEHPVFLRRKCGHAGWANSQALALAGITAETPDPPGGEIERDPHSGEPTGILKEHAMNLIFGLLSEPSPAEAVDAVRAAMAQAHRQGIVGVHNMEAAPALRAMQELRAAGELKLRVLAQIPESDLDAAIQMGLESGLGDDRLRIGGVKIFSDGALGARTAHMLAPFEGEPDNYGIPVASAEHLRDILEKASRAGIAVFTHAIGDAANRTVLDAIEASRQAGLGLHLRHRIEHAQILHPADIARFARLNVIPSMQPIHCTQDMVMADAHWGERCAGAYAWRSLLESGASLAFGSDAPVEAPDVLAGIHAAVTRRRADGKPEGGWYPEQCLTVDEAVYAYTAGAAFAGGEDDSRGAITSGKLADLVVLSQDIFSIDPMDILNTKVVATLFDGEFVHGEEALVG